MDNEIITVDSRVAEKIVSYVELNADSESVIRTEISRSVTELQPPKVETWIDFWEKMNTCVQVINSSF